MSDTTTKTRYYRAHDVLEKPRQYGDVLCEEHALVSTNLMLELFHYPLAGKIKNMDDGVELMNLISRVQGNGGKAISEEHDVEFQLCPTCEKKAAAAEADQQSA